MVKKLLHPELEEGIRVQFKDRNEATRQGRIITRQGNKVTVEAALKVRMRVPAENISGYWAPKVKASPKNLKKLTAKEVICGEAPA